MHGRRMKYKPAIGAGFARLELRVPGPELHLTPFVLRLAVSLVLLVMGCGVFRSTRLAPRLVAVTPPVEFGD
jgi:hypothetical protein